MKTWSEDNWFIRLDRLFEKERVITARSLLPDNIDKFPGLYEDLFKREPLKFTDFYIPNLEDFERMFRLGDMVCRETCEGTFETFIEFIFPYLVRDFIEMIPARIERRRQAAYNKVKDTEEYRNVRKIEAEYLKMTNAYTSNPKKKAELDAAYTIMTQKFCFSSKLKSDPPHLDPIDPGPSAKGLPGREKAFFIYTVQHLGISDSDIQNLREKLNSLPDDAFIGAPESSLDRVKGVLEEVLMSYFEDIKDSVISNGCKIISRGEQSNKDLLKHILFDFRSEEICINTDYFLIKDCLGSDKVNDLESKYKCDAFVEGLPSLGDSNSTYVERKYCSRTQSLGFGMLLRDPKTEIAKRFTEILPENIFTGMLEHAVYLDDDAGFQNPDDEYKKGTRVDVVEFGEHRHKSLPTMAIRPAEYTSQLFTSKLGGQLVLDDNKHLFLKVGRTLLSPQEARDRWKNYYKADVLYLYDHPSKVYSDGTPAKIYFPVQVKSVKTNILRRNEPVLGESAHLGNMSASAKLLRSLVDPEAEGLTTAERDNLAAQVISLLVYGDYLLTVNTWDRWCYLPLTEDLYKREYNFIQTKGAKGNASKEFKDEFTIPLNTPSGTVDTDVKMRVANRIGKNTPGDIHVEIFPGGIRL